MGRPQHARANVITALHHARLKPFLDECRQNDKDALKLYRWNVQLSGELHQLLSLAEVVVRNAMDRALQTWNAERSPTVTSWLIDEPASPLRSLTAGKRKRALESARRVAATRVSTHVRFRAPVNHDDVLAQVTFGMWKDLLPNHLVNAGRTIENGNRARMWSEALQAAFPNESDPDGRLTFWRVYRLHQLRNRVAHMESLLAVDVGARVIDALHLLRSVDEDAHAWVSGSDPVMPVVRARSV